MIHVTLVPYISLHEVTYIIYAVIWMGLYYLCICKYMSLCICAWLCICACMYVCLCYPILLVFYNRVIWNQNETSCLLLVRAGFEPRLLRHQRTYYPLTYRLSYRGARIRINSIARPYGEWACCPLDAAAEIGSTLPGAIYIIIGKWFPIEKREYVFLW